ncbi:MAG: hypothetical protein ACLP1X_31110 [Polyangiaceae bacterium]
MDTPSASFKPSARSDSRPSPSRHRGWSEIHAESCDGTDLGGATCASNGFSGGTLACTSLCTFDTNGCTTCLTDPHILACETTALPADTPSSLALAATGQDIVVAWVAGPGENGDAPGVAGAVRVARFSADLTLLAQYDCLGPLHAGRVALARSTTGYMLAADGDGGVTVQPLDANGAPRGTPHVVPNAEFPMLAARDQGGTVSDGPLLAWSVWPQTTPNAGGLQVEAVLLDDNGVDEIAPVTVFPVAVQQPRGNYNAVFTGDGYLIAAEGSELIARMALDGTITLPSTAALGSAEFGRLAWTGTEARFVYLGIGSSASSPGVSSWVSVDATGALLGEPVALAGAIYLAPPLATLGQDTVIVYGTPTGIIDQATTLSVTRISATGTVVTSAFGVVTDPQGLHQAQMAVSGSDVVLAWVGGGYPGRIALAQLAP